MSIKKEIFLIPGSLVQTMVLYLFLKNALEYVPEDHFDSTAKNLVGFPTLPIPDERTESNL
jgi:hypothetical protein